MEKDEKQEPFETLEEEDLIEAEINALQQKAVKGSTDEIELVHELMHARDIKALRKELFGI